MQPNAFSILRIPPYYYHQTFAAPDCISWKPCQQVSLSSLILSLLCALEHYLIRYVEMCPSWALTKRNPDKCPPSLLFGMRLRKSHTSCNLSNYLFIKRGLGERIGKTCTLLLVSFRISNAVWSVIGVPSLLIDSRHITISSILLIISKSSHRGGRKIRREWKLKGCWIERAHGATLERGNRRQAEGRLEMDTDN